MTGLRTHVADSEELRDTEPPDELARRCPEYPETHTQIDLRKGYFYCEECSHRNEHPRYQFIYDESRDALIAHFDFLEQWGRRPFV